MTLFIAALHTSARAVSNEGDPTRGKVAAGEPQGFTRVEFEFEVNPDTLISNETGAIMKQAKFKGEGKYSDHWAAFDDGYVQGLEIGREGAIEAVLKSCEQMSSKTVVVEWLRAELERLKATGTL